MCKQKNKIALIGCGGIAAFHVEALRALGDVEIIGVYDANTERARVFAREKKISVLESKEALLASDADAVAICTPSGLHVPLAVACMEAGKHAVVEKPVAITEEGCRAVLEAEKRTGRLCAPISQLRYAADVRRAKAIVESGELGKVVLCDLYMKYYRDASYYAGSWRGTKEMDGGGALMNQGIHGIDVMRYIVGDIAEVSGRVRTMVHDIEVEDTAVATVTFQNGAVGVIEGTTSVRPGYPRRMEIHLEKGSILLEENSIVAIDTPTGSEKAAEKPMNAASDPLNISSTGHRAQYENIFAAFRGKEPLFYTAEDAVRSVQTILAIYRSSEQNKAQRL